ncbi:hypothetical protein ACLOJK_041213 [Asimina triloba]
MSAVFPFRNPPAINYRTYVGPSPFPNSTRESFDYTRTGGSSNSKLALTSLLSYLVSADGSPMDATDVDL